MLLYGEMGAGKTRFCADAPNPIWFDTEDSTETLRNWQEYREIPVKTPKDPDEMIADVEQIVKDGIYKTIVIDSITTALDHFMRERLTAAAKKPNSRRVEDEFYQQDYKFATQAFTRMFDFLQHAPINVVVIGHENLFFHPEEKVTYIFPDITPKLRRAIGRLVNVVAYLQAEPRPQRGMSRKVYINKTALIEAKNRLNLQQIYIDNPTWKEVFNV
jgi:hypothetical protein